MERSVPNLADLEQRIAALENGRNLHPGLHRCKPWCDEAATRYAKGETLVVLAASLGSAAATIAMSLRAHGVVMRRKGPRLKGQSRLHAEILRLWQGGTIAAEIARQVNISRERVRQVLIANGVAWPTHPHTRHKCTEACRVVQAAERPVAILTLAKATGIIANGLHRAAKIHEVETRHEKPGHVCDERCATLLAGLKAGMSTSQAAFAAGWATLTHIYSNLKIYHPDWPWTKTEDRRGHRHGPKCDLFRAALERRESIQAAIRASGIRSKELAYNGLRVYHPDWPWPARRAESVAVVP